MSAKRIYTYVTAEIITPTLLSLLIFSMVLLMGRIPRVMELVISKGVATGEIAKLFAFLMPNFFSITVPLSFLLGILLAFGRLSADSEFIALKASGVSLYQLLRPVILLALLFTLLTGTMTMFVVPASKAAFKNKLFEIASSSASLDIRPGVFNDDFPGIVLYARGVDEQLGVMHDLLISDERSTDTPTMISASQGRFISDPTQLRLTLRLADGTIHRQPQKSDSDSYQTINFSNYNINIDTSAAFDGKRRTKRNEMSWSILNQSIAKARARTEQNERKKSELYSLETEKHQRVVIAFAPLVLILVGVPLGLQSQRSGKGAGFTLALAVFLIYYILLSLAAAIAEKGTLPAAMILWLPNLCFLAGGAYFLHCTATEKTLPIVRLTQMIVKWLKNVITRKGDTA